MTRFSLALGLACAACASPAQAQLFPRGADALRYGAYTGGHAYSYNTAYSYGFSFSPADTWRRDPWAYPAGIYPYRPSGQPITSRVFPRPGTAYISVPGADGLPILMPVLPDGTGGPAVAVTPVPALAPVPAAAQGGRCEVRIVAPEGAEVWVDKEKLPADTAGFRTA